jgi:hypothetical protein
VVDVIPLIANHRGARDRLLALPDTGAGSRYAHRMTTISAP